MSYPQYHASQYSPLSHSSSISSSPSGSISNYSTSHSSIAARYEAAKSFDLEDDLEYCPVLTIDEVRQYYDDVTAKSIFFPTLMAQHSPPSQSSTPSPPNSYIYPSSHNFSPARPLVHEPQQTPIFRPSSRGRGTAAIKIIDPSTREERRRQYY
jgi:hypothetical protein